jgi:hypothetical protein
MGLVQNVDISLGQDFSKAALTQRPIGHQQVVIDDHDLGLLSLPPRLHQKAFTVERTLLTQTVVRGGGDTGHQGRFAGGGWRFGKIATARAS